MYYVYILRCMDETLYTGITTEPERRVYEHISGGVKCAKYTRSHPPKRVEKVFETSSKSAASTLEYRIKELPRKKKEKFLESTCFEDFFAGKLDSAEYLECDSEYISYLNRIFEKQTAKTDQEKFNMEKKIPVILDTDIGSDLDDSWALALLLKCPELDLKLVTTEEGDAIYKSKLCAKMLTAAGRTDVPVGVGITTNSDVPNIADWVEDFDLSSYPNVIEDGVQAIIDTVMSSEEKVTILAIGPFKTLAAAVEREPRIIEKSKILGVCGNIYNGAAAEYNWYHVLGREANINADLDSYRRTMEKEGWEVEMVPLDLTGNLYLAPELYSKIEAKRHTDPLIAALMESCEVWYKNTNFNFYGQSSCLFDTAGVYAAFTHENMEYQVLPIKASDDALTLINMKEGKDMDVAIRWYDKPKFYEFLVERLCAEL